MCQQGVKFVGRNSENWKWENVFNGRATTSGHMDKWRPQLDSVRQIGLRCMSHECSDCSVDVPTSGEVCWAKIRNQKGSGDVFPNGATTGNLGIKWRIPLDWPLFYPPILNDYADLLVVRNVCYG